MSVLLRTTAESAPVTQWPLRLLLVGIVAAVIVAALAGMRRGWRNRAARQSGIPAPPTPPAALGDLVLPEVGGVYLATVISGDWLDRVVVHGLGVRSRAVLRAGPAGVLLLREGAPDLFVPRGSLRAVRTDRGIAGKAYERDGVLILTWDLGGRLVDTGFRADAADDQAAVHVALDSLVADERTP
ncbi:MAG: hypothetical protein ACR2KE_02420 [Candidatus Nanopelagicales bacterium]